MWGCSAVYHFQGLDNFLKRLKLTRTPDSAQLGTVMSLYHEAADVLDTSKSDGGNLRSRVFGRKDRKSSPAQIYALALETCKWSLVLKEVVENAQLLQHEKKVRLRPSSTFCVFPPGQWHLANRSGSLLPSSRCS